MSACNHCNSAAQPPFTSDAGKEAGTAVPHSDFARDSRRSGSMDQLPGLPWGGALQPGVWRPYEHRKLANPAPLGLCGFATSAFVLSCVNLQARGVEAPNIAIPMALIYGGFIQILAGMWEMAVGNTFGATALSSYGGFWMSYGILLSPPWNISSPVNGPYSSDAAQLNSAVGLYLTGWFILTTVLLLCTLRSTVAFVFLFLTLDLAYLFLACESFAKSVGHLALADRLRVAGGVFGILAAFAAWYNALAGLMDDSNSFFKLPVIYMPWSDKAGGLGKKERDVEKQHHA
ncbi:unnamed protein product [Clonostachys rhizophaga]|uniref:Uncharacterized protein n=1 Tax=Clonostachys rhizophaga TaxID=160324 RepID=A0A9N9YQU5_9HYPO|nr:unnamed protein product [Clonostachys rhizophaga]